MYEQDYSKAAAARPTVYDALGYTARELGPGGPSPAEAAATTTTPVEPPPTQVPAVTVEPAEPRSADAGSLDEKLAGATSAEWYDLNLTTDDTEERPATPHAVRTKQTWRRKGPRNWWTRLFVTEVVTAMVVGLFLLGYSEWSENRRNESAANLEKERQDLAFEIDDRREARAQRLENLRFVRTAVSQLDRQRFRAFADIDLAETSLTGLDLEEANLSSANLERANLSNTKLSAADLSGANLIAATVNAATAQGTNFGGARSRDANFSGALLTQANFSGATLTGATLSGTDLTDANFFEADLAHADLFGANLTGTNFTGADLTATSFDQACVDDGLMPVWPEGFRPLNLVACYRRPSPS